MLKDEKLCILCCSRAVMCRAGKAVELSTEHRCYGKGKVVKEETQRIKTAGGWVKNGRVCDMLAVTRAFGDAEFKGANNLSRLLEMGVRCVDAVVFITTSASLVLSPGMLPLLVNKPASRILYYS